MSFDHTRTSLVVGWLAWLTKFAVCASVHSCFALVNIVCIEILRNLKNQNISLWACTSLMMVNTNVVDETFNFKISKSLT